MKVLRFLPVLFLFFGLTASLKAQQVNYRNEKVFLNNQLYGYLIKKGSVWAKDYSFQSTKNEEIATIKAVNKEMLNGHDYVFYEVSFKGYTQKAEMDENPSFDRQLAIEMAVYNILKNDVLNPEGVDKFLARYPAVISKRLDGKLIKTEPKATASITAPTPDVISKPIEMPVKTEAKPEAKTDIQPTAEAAKATPKSEPTVVVVAVPVPMSAYSNPEVKASPALVEPAPAPVAKTEPVNVPAKTVVPSVPGLKITGTSILKGTRKVGRFAVNEQAVNNNLKKSYGFYNVKNLKVASATFATQQSTACKIYTPKDKKTRTVNIANNAEALKALSGWLVQNRYL
jgi:hypothetical protein